MKKLSVIATGLTLLTCLCSIALADIKMKDQANFSSSDRDSYFGGTITSASYGHPENKNGKKTAEVRIGLELIDKKLLEIVFSGEDLPIGISLMNAQGKYLSGSVSKDGQFNIDDVLVIIKP